MNKEEWMQIWEKVFDANQEDIENAPTLTENEVQIIVHTLCVCAEVINAKKT